MKYWGIKDGCVKYKTLNLSKLFTFAIYLTVLYNKSCMIFFNLTLKMIWFKVFYELGNKLQPLNNGIRTGDWVHLAELLGFSRQQIDHFEVRSHIQREPPGFLMLMEWRSHEDRSTLFILRDTLWTCGRHDCVTFLDRRVEGKNTDSIFGPQNKTRYNP